MGVGKIFVGVVIIVLAITIWAGIMHTNMLNVFVDSPDRRYEFRETLEQFQAIYFILAIGAGIGLAVWGAQS